MKGQVFFLSKVKLCIGGLRQLAASWAICLSLFWVRYLHTTILLFQWSWLLSL